MRLSWGSRAVSEDFGAGRWLPAVRAALGGPLLSVCWSAADSGVQFIVVAEPGEEVEAIERVVEALSSSGEVPPFLLDTLSPPEATPDRLVGYERV